MILDYPDEPIVITKVVKNGRGREPEREHRGTQPHVAGFGDGGKGHEPKKADGC